MASVKKKPRWGRRLRRIIETGYPCMGGVAMLNKTFKAKLQKNPTKGGWTYVVWPGSVKFFGTKGLVKIKGAVDGHSFRSSFMAMGNGIHMLPVKADIRKAIGKEAGDVVTVRLDERI